MADSVQSYKNHTRLFPPFHFFVMPVLGVNMLNQAWHVWLTPNRSTAFGLLVSLALVMLALSARMMAVTAQDRIIRLEMRLRLRECLPPDLQSRIADLTSRQLIALRFAGDAELPELVREVLDGRLASSKAIKMRVKNWQGDFLRV